MCWAPRTLTWQHNTLHHVVGHVAALPVTGRPAESHGLAAPANATVSFKLSSATQPLHPPSFPPSSFHFSSLPPLRAPPFPVNPTPLRRCAAVAHPRLSPSPPLCPSRLLDLWLLLSSLPSSFHPNHQPHLATSSLSIIIVGIPLVRSRPIEAIRSLCPLIPETHHSLSMTRIPTSPMTNFTIESTAVTL